MTFEGYTEDTRAFFMALRFNNNREFFHDSRDWYLKSVREPSLALAEALAPVIETIDPRIETRSHRALARVNRDTRFSRDKSPYRDHVWVSFRRPEEERGRAPSFFVEVGVDGVFFGMGAYAPERARMNAVRRHLRLAPDEAAALLMPLEGDFALHGDAYKRLAVPDGLPEALIPLYRLKSYYWERSLPFARALSPRLAEEVGAGLTRLGPLYSFLTSCIPEEEDFQ